KKHSKHSNPGRKEKKSSSGSDFFLCAGLVISFERYAPSGSASASAATRFQLCAHTTNEASPFPKGSVDRKSSSSYGPRPRSFVAFQYFHLLVYSEIRRCFLRKRGLHRQEIRRRGTAFQRYQALKRQGC